jgi:hypothetical protein
VTQDQDGDSAGERGRDDAGDRVDIEGLVARMEAWERLAQDRDARVRAAFEAGAAHPYGLTWQPGDVDLWNRIEASDPAPDAGSLPAEAVRAWLVTDDAGRAALVDAVARCRLLRYRIDGHVYGATKDIETWTAEVREGRRTAADLANAAPSRLREGLAAAALENAGIDYRDTILALDRLYLAALDAGIEPAPEFAAAAAHADDTLKRFGPTGAALLAMYATPDRVEQMARRLEQRWARAATGGDDAT